VIGGGALVGALPAFAVCASTDIHTKRWNWHVEHGYAITVGEIENLCADPIGVQMQIIFRDKAGNAVDSEEFWPNGTQNIPAGASRVFKWINEYNSKANTADLIESG
jgi:hypothetical protein